MDGNSSFVEKSKICRTLKSYVQNETSFGGVVLKQEKQAD
jgi:hypothetical protein